VDLIVGEDRPSAEVLAQIRADLGLDQPLPVQYWTWLSRAAQGDFGYSYRSRRPVMQVVAERLPLTLELSALSIVFGLAVALPLGIIAALNRGKWPDALATALAGPGPGARALMGYLIAVNAIVGAFNLVPGFPLDGGRLLRAVLWKLQGNLQSATRMASRAGGLVALGLIGLGVVRVFTGEFLGGIWLVLIGLFLRQAAEGSYQQLVLRDVLGPLAVRDVMSRDVIQIPADLSVDRVVEDFFWRHRVSSFPVVDDGRVVGIVALDQLKQVPPERRAEMTVRQLMLPLTEPLVAAPADPLARAFEKLTLNGLGRLVVLDRGRLVGYLSVKDVMHVLAVKAG